MQISEKSDNPRLESILCQSSRFNLSRCYVPRPRHSWPRLQPTEVRAKRSLNYLCAISASYTATGFVCAMKSCK